MNLESLNVQELNTNEMKNVDGGFVFVAIALVGALLLFTGCNNNIEINVGAGSGNDGNGSGNGSDSTNVNNNFI